MEKDKNLDLGRALRLAADNQPVKVDTNVIDNVRGSFTFESVKTVSKYVNFFQHTPIDGGFSYM